MKLLYYKNTKSNLNKVLVKMLSFYILKTIRNYVVLKITFHLQNLQFHQNLQTDSSELFSATYNGIIHNLLFWHEAA